MAQSIMDVMESNLDVRSVSNALYEMMVDWRNQELLARQAPTASQTKKRIQKRKWIEEALGRFLQVDQLQVQRLLNQHFFPGEKIQSWQYSR